ncbi:YdeI/OmpD-associated family protein [Umezawaea tangerina]|uniref:Uncharacterized protein YdeI (YjbR/CyaY-like superfamily) n=1 Tax=Umezawaea tangerina TaxID=84725 RepID=A0A2T0TGU3_9PSEU|nr:YdeI/OmpD-associated family protein [Umezawaea tangerina]PRY44916.1 uncharacterized protein YdeI (YjbR/CyaY-like superfamily) [Umezawaea tangerina]
MTTNPLLVTSTSDWRRWLSAHHDSDREVWLVIPHKTSTKTGPRYAEAIEHALCFGWIDSHARKHDDDSSLLRFTPRSPRGTWSAVNRERATRMESLGLMTTHGRALVDLAKSTGTWQVLPDDDTTVPTDLQEQLARNTTATTNFHAFPPSSKRLILQWVATAKKPETRRRRIDRTVELAALGIRANHPGVRLRDIAGGASAATCQ